MKRKVIKIRLVSLIMIIISIIVIIFAIVFVVNKLKKDDNIEVEEANNMAFFF